MWIAIGAIAASIIFWLGYYVGYERTKMQFDKDLADAQWRATTAETEAARFRAQLSGRRP